MESPRLPRVVQTGRDVFAAVAAWRRQGKRIGLVPTMGALHDGHLSLVAAARRSCDVVIVSLFVNPTQFGPSEDYAKYPRTLDADLQRLAPLNVDLVFAPSSDEMYPPGHATSVDVGGVSETLEGPLRPGHFRGVATVVLKLFHLAPADAAFFGQKDYQQALVIRRMTADLNVPIAIQVCPIVREPDGLAMSSRNAYLSADERQRALVLHWTLQNVVAQVAAGQRDAKRIMATMRSTFDATPGVTLDYAVIADAETLALVDQIAAPCVALVAARVGATRLIDNELLRP